jgi:hypothetical protein
MSANIRHLPLLLACALLLVCTRAGAQGLGPSVGGHMSFNFDDISGGLQAGATIVDLDLDFRADFTARLGNKRVLVPIDGQDNAFYQYRESRYLLGIEAEKRITLHETGGGNLLGVSAMLLGGYTFGDFHGTKVNPEAAWTYRARLAPFIWIDQSVLLRAGYEYSPYQSPSVPDHRFFLAITFCVPE